MPANRDLPGDTPSDFGEAALDAASLKKRHALRKAMLSLHERVRSRTTPLHCFLDEQPPELTPATPLRRLEPSGADAALFVNPTLQVRPFDDPPEEIAAGKVPLDGFLGGSHLAWVKDPGSGLWAPFWVRGEWLDLLRALEPGQPAPSTMSAEARRLLALATILVPFGFYENRSRQWKEICETARSQFSARRYAILRDLIHPAQLGAMRRYYRELVASGGIPLGDFQVANRYQLGNEVVARFYHQQLVNLMARIAGEPVKPSYVYLACYRPGAELRRHTDREQCEFSVSLLIDYVPEPRGACGWPLILEDPAEPGIPHPVDLGIGDALLYRGRELEHYRHALPPDHSSTSLFLHYVRENFAGSLW